LSEKILILEDQEGLAKLIKRALNHAGYECGIALTLKEAKSLLKGNGFSLCVADLQVPGGFGNDTIEGVLEVAHNAAIVVVTGHYDRQHALEVMERYGVCYYIAKTSEDYLKKLPEIVEESIARGRYLATISRESAERQEAIERLTGEVNALKATHAASLADSSKRQEILTTENGRLALELAEWRKVKPRRAISIKVQLAWISLLGTVLAALLTAIVELLKR
jgi:Response regulator containing CheY-like receiver, AAA-type ATPase, and DNA-binding domains